MAAFLSQRWQRQPVVAVRPAEKWAKYLRFLHNFGFGGSVGFESLRVRGGMALAWTGTAQAPAFRDGARGGASLCFSGDGTNYLAGSGSADITAAANEPIAVFAYFRTSATQTQPLSVRGPFGGSLPIANLSVGANGAASASGQFIPLVRDNGGSATWQTSGPSVNDGAFHLALIQRDAAKWQWSVDASALADIGTAGTAMGATTFQENNVGYAADTLNSGINGACDVAVGGLMVGRTFTQDEINSLWLNPWQLFRQQQRRIYVRVPSGANAFGGIFLPQRWRRQPPSGYAELDRGHLLLAGATGVWAAQQPTRTLVTNENAALSSGAVQGFSSTGLNITTRASQLDRITVAADVDTILPADRLTWCVLRRSQDTTARTSILGGYANANRVLSHAPWSDGNIYFDFISTTPGAGGGRVSTAFTKSTNIEALVFVAGPNKGREIWRNGLKIVGDATVNQTGRVGDTTGFTLGSDIVSGTSSDSDEFYQSIWIDGEWSEAHIKAWSENPYQIFRPARRRLYFGTTGGATAYSLTAATGTYTITGSVAKTLHAILINAAAGAYTISGTSAKLLAARLLSASLGTYVISGQSASLFLARKISANAGSYNVSGVSTTTLRALRLALDAGGYDIAGASATLIYTPIGSASSSSLYIDLNNGHLIWRLL